MTDGTRSVEGLLPAPYAPLIPLSNRLLIPGVVRVEAGIGLFIILEVWIELTGGLRSGPERIEAVPQRLLAMGKDSAEIFGGVLDEKVLLRRS
jgi:hypothetical protein